MDVNWSSNGLVARKTVYRGFTDDPNVKIRFIAENKRSPVSRPPVKQFKEQPKPDLMNKLNSMRSSYDYDDDANANDKPVKKFWQLDSPIPFEPASTEPSENCYSTYNLSSGRKSSRGSNTL